MKNSHSFLIYYIKATTMKTCFLETRSRCVSGRETAFILCSVIATKFVVEACNVIKTITVNVTPSTKQVVIQYHDAYKLDACRYP